jgi:hypothetical protein
VVTLDFGEELGVGTFLLAGGTGEVVGWGSLGGSGLVLLPVVDLFKDPKGLPGPRFLFTRVGKLLSEGSNTILAL